MRITTFEEFTELATRGTFVPVCQEMVADLLTPVSAFMRIAEHSDHAFLLESVEGGEHVGRYSFLGKDPFLILRATQGGTTVQRAGETSESDRPFVETLRELMAEYHSPFVPELPRFTGGAVGYLSYDTAAWFEPVTLQPLPAADEEAAFMLFDTVLAFDHLRHRILIIANARIAGDEDLESLYQFACTKIAFLRRELERELSHGAIPAHEPLSVTPNMPRQRFEEMARTAKEYIAAGDIYQVVLSQRFEAHIDADPFTVYRALRHVNPSPYMYFLRMGGRSIVPLKFFTTKVNHHHFSGHVT
jgi:anthranilate synthase component 1